MAFIPPRKKNNEIKNLEKNQLGRVQTNILIFKEGFCFWGAIFSRRRLENFTFWEKMKNIP